VSKHLQLSAQTTKNIGIVYFLPQRSKQNSLPGGKFTSHLIGKPTTILPDESSRINMLNPVFSIQYTFTSHLIGELRGDIPDDFADSDRIDGFI